MEKIATRNHTIFENMGKTQCYGTGLFLSGAGTENIKVAPAPTKKVKTEKKYFFTNI